MALGADMHASIFRKKRNRRLEAVASFCHTTDMDKQLLFVFGSHPQLSLAEIEAWGEGHKAGLTVEAFEEPLALVSGLSDSLVRRAVRDIAGAVKIAEVVEIAPPVRAMNEAQIVSLLFNAVSPATRRLPSVTFGVSMYGALQYLPNARAQERIALEIKKALKQDGRHVRWVSGRGRPLTSVQVDKNKLDGERGVELIVWATRERFVVARTIGVQAFEDWGARDYGRPRRNAKQGMLPPKLARMMVNMLGLSPSGTLLDPFVGSGTVLMEAAMLGWSNLIGSDVNQRAVKDTQQNLQWLKEQAKVSFSATYLTSPIERLVGRVKPGSVRAIVTEPFLGPPLRQRPSVRDIERLERELLPLYSDMLSIIAELLELNGRAVVTVPVWVTNTNTEHQLTILDHALPKSLRLVPAPTTHGRPLVYSRSNQIVGRSVVRVEKVSRHL